MQSFWVLILLIISSSLPIVAIYIWIRLAKLPLSVIQFLFALLAGAAAFFPALLMQDLLDISFSTATRTAFFYQYFIRIALSEELSRLIMLFIFFWISGKIKPEKDSVKKGTLIGLIAGFGFSLLESSRHAASGMDLSLIFFRVFTAALHGACGSRIGAAAVLFPKNPVQAILRILTATAIHGIYNFMVIMPNLSSVVAIIIALTALITAIMSVRGSWTEEDDPAVNNEILQQALPQALLDKTKDNQ
ncbi:MAG: PrsW family glutamic-type intramembrane protease [Treponema sp.]|nr:PrsW family glutamic-type intramembrane protease [Treponema sp.]